MLKQKNKLLAILLSVLLVADLQEVATEVAEVRIRMQRDSESFLETM